MSTKNAELAARLCRAAAEDERQALAAYRTALRVPGYPDVNREHKVLDKARDARRCATNEFLFPRGI